MKNVASKSKYKMDDGCYYSLEELLSILEEGNTIYEYELAEYVKGLVRNRKGFFCGFSDEAVEDIARDVMVDVLETLHKNPKELYKKPLSLYVDLRIKHYKGAKECYILEETSLEEGKTACVQYLVEAYNAKDFINSRKYLSNGEKKVLTAFIGDNFLSGGGVMAVSWLSRGRVYQVIKRCRKKILYHDKEFFNGLNGVCDILL